MIRPALFCVMAIGCGVAMGSGTSRGGSSSSAAGKVPDDFHVTLRSSNGSVPPPSHHGRTIELSAMGSGSEVATVGYDGKVEHSRTLSVRPEAVAGFYALLTRRNAFGVDWTGGETGRVGGGCTFIVITAKRKRTEIPCEVPKERNALKREIEAAIEALRDGSAP